MITVTESVLNYKSAAGRADQLLKCGVRSVPPYERNAIFNLAIDLSTALIQRMIVSVTKSKSFVYHSADNKRP
jgi:hypothetical protein